MTIKWQSAIEKYQQVNEGEKRAEKRSVETEQKRQQEHFCTQEKINQATRDLEQFMSSEEGLTAKALLRVSGRHINFGEDREGGGFGVVYFIDGNGLHQSVEAMGTWQVYTANIPEPKISSINARQAIKAAVHYAGRKPDEVLYWLRGKLDEIANFAPQTSVT